MASGGAVVVQTSEIKFQPLASTVAVCVEIPTHLAVELTKFIPLRPTARLCLGMMHGVALQ
jgi:hypothetical protein